jgi:hypothetical protein
MSTKKPSPVVVYILSILFAILILFANFSIWFERNILDEEQFKKIAVETLTMESSRQAIASEIVTRAISKWPTVYEVLGDPLEKYIADFIDGPMSQTIIEKTVSILYYPFSGKEPEPVSIDLGVAKPISDLAMKAASLFSPELAQKIEDLNISEKIDKVAIWNEKIQTLSENLKNFLRLGWLAVLFAGLILVFLIFRYNDWTYSLKRVGIILAVAAVLNIFIDNNLDSKLLAMFENENLKIIVQNLYNILVTSLNKQVFLVMILGIIIAVVGFAGDMWKKKSVPAESIVSDKPAESENNNG